MCGRAHTVCACVYMMFCVCRRCRFWGVRSTIRNNPFSERDRPSRLGGEGGYPSSSGVARGGCGGWPPRTEKGEEIIIIIIIKNWEKEKKTPALCMYGGRYVCGVWCVSECVCVCVCKVDAAAVAKTQHRLADWVMGYLELMCTYVEAGLPCLCRHVSNSRMLCSLRAW